MSDIAQFVVAAQKADPALVGADKVAIDAAEKETEQLTSDLKVGLDRDLC